MSVWLCASFDGAPWLRVSRVNTGPMPTRCSSGYQQGRLGVSALMRPDGLLLVVLVPSATALNNADANGDIGGTIVLELGKVRVRIEGQPDAVALAQVLDRILR